MSLALGLYAPGMAKRAKASARGSSAAAVYVALLRGINVGGKNKLPMSNLAAFFGEAGCAEIRTYIQSGNIVFSASAGTVKRLPNLVARRIAERFRYRVPVVVRSADALRKVAAKNPFLKAGSDADSLHVVFLAGVPDARCVKALDPDRSPGESFKVIGQEIYLHLPNGVARSKLTNAYFDSTLATISTVRNWRTVMKLVEMTEGAG